MAGKSGHLTRSDIDSPLTERCHPATLSQPDFSSHEKGHRHNSLQGLFHSYTGKKDFIRREKPEGGAGKPKWNCSNISGEKVAVIQMSVASTLDSCQRNKFT